MMDTSLRYRLFADAVLVLHVTIVFFIVGGLLLIIMGNAFKWNWVNALWFRLAHLLAIFAVIAESWLEIACPLTTLEIWLRTKAGAGTYTGGFIEHWLQYILFYEAPSWVFMLTYSLFGLAVAVVWWRFPPHFRSPKH